MSTILHKSHSGVVRSQGRGWWAATQPASISLPCLAIQVLRPCTASHRALLPGAWLDLGVFLKILLGFQLEIELFPSKVEPAAFPSPGNQLLYHTVHTSVKQTPLWALWAPVVAVSMLRARSPSREAPSLSSSGVQLESLYATSPLGPLLSFRRKKKRQGWRNVCSIFHSWCKDVTWEWKWHCYVGSKWSESSAETGRGKAEC